MTFFNLSFQKRFLIALCLLPLVIYVVFFEAISINANYVAYDDIHVLQIVEQWRNAVSWHEKLDWLTVGFPEHRIVFTRLVVLISYGLTGGVSLKSLMIVSNVLWVAQLGILFNVFKKLSIDFFYFIPLCWILLNVHSFENIFWGTSSLGNFGLLFFTMVAAYGYTQSNLLGVWLGVLFSIAATFSYGNGLLTFLIGGTILALSRRWRDLGYTFLVFIVTMGLYVLTRAHASPSSLDLTQPANYLHAVVCFLAFLGSSVNFDAYAPSMLAVWASVGWGAVLLGICIWLLLRNSTLSFKKIELQLNSVQWFGLFLLFFVCLTSLGVVYKRAEGDGLIGMFKGRYRMYPTWLLVVTYLLVLDWLRDKQNWRWLTSFSVAAISFNLLVLYYSVAPATNNRRIAIAQEFNSMYNADLLGLKMFDLTGEDFLRLQKLYQPSLFFREYEKQWKAPTLSLDTNGVFSLDSVYWDRDRGNLNILYRKDFIRPSKNLDDGAYIVLKSTSHAYMAAGIQQALPLKTFVRRRWYWDRGFVATFVPTAIAKGTYRIYLLRRQNGISELLSTRKEVTF